MNKFIPILIVGVLLISGLGAVATPERDLKKVPLSFSNLLVEEKDNYITLDLEGTNSVLMKKDHYIVPTRIETFMFPLGTEIISVQCTPKNIHTLRVTKELMIAPAPRAIGQTALNEKVQSNVNPVAMNVWYDYDVGTGIHENEINVFVKVETFPVQYHSSENIIEWAENIEIDIQYKEPEQPVIFGDTYNFVILGPSEFSDELASLVTHKINRGISTIFVSLTDIYNGVHFPVQGRDNQEKIKYFIKNAIETWGTSSVLLVGGSIKFPTRETHVFISDDPPEPEVFVSDLYYADIYYDGTTNFCSWDSNGNDIFGEYNWNGETDDVDLYPDVYLGRLACVNGNEVTTAVNKIKTYENNEAYTQGWFTDLIVVGGDTWPDDTQGIYEGEYHNQQIIDIMDGFVHDKLWVSEGDLSGVAPTGAQKISNAINTGSGFLFFSGHGNPSAWATHPYQQHSWLPTPIQGYYNSPHVSSLSNGNKLPIVVISACSTSKFNSDSDCFNWKFITNSNGGGIASIGATGFGYSAGGQYTVCIDKISKTTFEAYRDEGALTFGEMWAKSLNSYIPTNPDKYDYKTVEEWEPFGDPTLAIGEESNPPAKPDKPDGPTSGATGQEHTYTTSTTDPDGDDVYYMFDWGDDTTSGWVGPYNSGQTGSAKKTWTSQGTYTVKVVARDDHGKISEWSDPLDVSMPRNKAFFNSILLEILERILERFPLLEQILASRPIIGGLLDI